METSCKSGSSALTSQILYSIRSEQQIEVKVGRERVISRQRIEAKA